MTEADSGAGVAPALWRAVTETASTAAGRAHRHDPVTPATGGPAGNARLTAWLGVLLLAGFLAEAVTLISVGRLISPHILIGAALAPLVVAKTATTGWRIARYYLGSATYRAAGPPPVLLRVLGPLVVLGGLAVVGSGLALVALGAGTFTNLVTIAGFRINALTIHQASFIVWLVATALHTLGRLMPAGLIITAREPHDREVAGRLPRLAALVTTIAAAVVVGLVVLHLSGAWTHHTADAFRHHDHRRLH